MSPTYGIATGIKGSERARRSCDRPLRLLLNLPIVMDWWWPASSEFGTNVLSISRHLFGWCRVPPIAW